MDKEKQIDEMAKDIGIAFQLAGTTRFGEVAECLISAGYRKERQGEWKKVNEKYPRYVCTAYNHLYNNKEYKYCPNCSARMKGE